MTWDCLEICNHFVWHIVEDLFLLLFLKSYKRRKSQTIDHHVKENTDLSCILLAACSIKKKERFCIVPSYFCQFWSTLIFYQNWKGTQCYYVFKNIIGKGKSRWNTTCFAWMSAYLYVHFVEKTNAKAPAVPWRGVGALWVGWAMLGGRLPAQI